MRYLVLFLIIAAIIGYFVAQRESSPSQTAAATTPSPAAVRAQLEEIAQKEGVQLTGIKQTGQEVTIQVQWIGDVAAVGGDYILAVSNAGLIRDFDEIGQGRIWVDQDNRRHWSKDFVLKLK